MWDVGDVRMKLSGRLVSGFMKFFIDLQSTCEEGMDVRQLTEEGFFTMFSYFSP